MTNFSTVSNSIKRLKELDSRLNSEEINALSKKEVLKMTRDRDKLNNSLGGIKDMGGLPDMLFVLDTIKDSIAINEAKTLNIPVVAVLDTNSNPDGIDYPIPGNDDALRAVTLYCNLISESIIDGLQAEMLKQEKDFDPKEKLPEEIDNTVSKNQTKDSNRHKSNEKTLNLSNAISTLEARSVSKPRSINSAPSDTTPSGTFIAPDTIPAIAAVIALVSELCSCGVRSK